MTTVRLESFGTRDNAGGGWYSCGVPVFYDVIEQ